MSNPLMTALRSFFEKGFSMKNAMLLLPVFLSMCAFAAPPQSGISVRLVPDRREYVVGDIANSSAESIDVGKPGSADIFRIEVFRARDMATRERVGKKPLVAPFLLHSSEKPTEYSFQ